MSDWIGYALLSVLSLVLVVLVFLAFYGSGQSSAYTTVCEQAGGVYVELTCIRKEATIDIKGDIYE